MAPILAPNSRERGVPDPECAAGGYPPDRPEAACVVTAPSQAAVAMTRGRPGALPMRRGLHRQERRSAEQVALPEVDLAFLKSDQVATVLDALGHHLGADPAAKRDESLDQGLLGLTVLVADAVDDLAIDLDDRRLERGDDREAGVARAGVVDGEAEAEAAERPNLLLEARHVGDGLLLGALDHDLAGRQAGRGGRDRRRRPLRSAAPAGWRAGG